MSATDTNPDPTSAPEGQFVDRLADSAGDDMSRKLAQQLRRQVQGDEPAAPSDVSPHERIALATLKTFGFQGSKQAGLDIVRNLVDVGQLAVDAGDDIDAFDTALDGALEHLATSFLAPMFTGPGSPNAAPAKPEPGRRRRRAVPADRSAPVRRRVEKSAATMTTAEVIAAARRPPDEAVAKGMSAKLRAQGGYDQARRERPKPWYEQEPDRSDPTAVDTHRTSRRLLGLDGGAS